LKTTRRLAVLPIVEPPADLEDRILEAAREAQKVVPLTRRASRVVSRAGSWAMRPQTGMAAVFLLGIGLSALLLQGRHAAPSSSMTVSDRGEPVASVATGTLERPPGEANDTKGSSPSFAAAPPPASPAATAIASAAPASEYGSGQAQDGMFGRGRGGAGGALAGRLNGASKSAANEAPISKSQQMLDVGDEQNAAPVAGAPAQPYAAAQAAPRRAAAPPGARPAPAAAADMEALKEAPAPNVQSQMVSSFDTAMAAYKSGDYATAKTQFDAIAARGDLSSALWAARSARDGTGCASAVARFDQVASAAAGTNVANDATLEAGRCYRQLNQSAAAQARFQSLLTLPAYVDRASNELAAMAPKPAAKAAARPAAVPAKPAAPPAASPPPVSTAY
jgi:TolA-binding protein